MLVSYSTEVTHDRALLLYALMMVSIIDIGMYINKNIHWNSNSNDISHIFLNLIIELCFIEGVNTIGKVKITLKKNIDNKALVRFVRHYLECMQKIRGGALDGDSLIESSDYDSDRDGLWFILGRRVNSKAAARK
ncbi:hypothetical protein ACH5RR_036868 [Cinchona calisaya]|uniref:Uncharacterized protein n=1 Tax=Cinchona calisaya TaxID=153742 RepID=A0ABD2Y827_9GENT